MKFLKTFEEVNDGPKVGDYVICTLTKLFDTGYENLKKFLSTNIGQLVTYYDMSDFSYNPDYVIRYEYVPLDLTWAFKKRNCRGIFDDEILFWSENKEDCEDFLASKKYNI